MRNQAEARKWWAEELRSGRFRQTAGMLTEKVKRFERDHGDVDWRHCCLGVACELAIKDGVQMTVEDRGDTRAYGDEEYTLPRAVQDWLGLWGPDGEYQGADEERGSRSLADHNDSGWSFEQIADVIESEPKGLFRD